MTEPVPPQPPPYWAVIFTSTRAGGADDGYAEAADRMEELATHVPGYLGIESVRDPSGLGISVSYWETEAAMTEWRNHPEHLETQARGRADWYSCYELRVARVERTRSFTA